MSSSFISSRRASVSASSLTNSNHVRVVEEPPSKAMLPVAPAPKDVTNQKLQDFHVILPLVVAKGKASPNRRSSYTVPRSTGIKSADGTTMTWARGSSGAPRRQLSHVEPQDLARAGVLLPSEPALPDPIICSKMTRENSKGLEDTQSMMVALPKKSPLKSQVDVRARRSSYASAATCTSREPSNTSITTNDSSNHSLSSPMRQSCTVDPQRLFSAGVSSGSLEPVLPDTTMIVATRDNSDSSDRSMTEIPLPKKSPLKQHVSRSRRASYRAPSPILEVVASKTRRHSLCKSPARVSWSRVKSPQTDHNSTGTQTTRRDASFSVDPTSFSNPFARRRSMVEPQELQKAGLIQDVATTTSSEEEIIVTPEKNSSPNWNTSLERNHNDAVRVLFHNDSSPTRSRNTSRSPSRRSPALKPKVATSKLHHHVPDLDGVESVTSSTTSVMTPSEVGHGQDGATSTTSTAANPESRTSSPSNGAQRQRGEDLPSKVGLRISHSAIHPQTTSTSSKSLPQSTTTSTTTSSYSTLSSVVESDARIKAGLRNQRASYVVVEQSSVISTGALATTSLAESASVVGGEAKSMLHEEIRTRRGLRPSVLLLANSSPQHSLTANAGNSSPPRTTCTTTTSDADARIKAGLRAQSLTVATHGTGQDEDDTTCNGRSPTRVEAENNKLGLGRSPTRSIGNSSAPLPIPKNSEKSTTSAGGLRRGHERQDDTKFQLRVARTETGSSTETTVSSATGNSSTIIRTNAPLNMRPGAYSATAALSQGEFSMERVDSLGKQGMATLGHSVSQLPATSIGPRTVRGHEVSHELSVTPSLFEMEEGVMDTSLFTDEVREFHSRANDKPSEQQGKSKRLLWVVVLAVAFVFVAVGIAVAVVLSNGSSAETATATTNSDPESTEEATAISQLGRLHTVFENPAAELPAETIVAIQFGTDATPQVKALEWISKDPNLPLYSTSKRKQRFALASFFYATNGERWFETDEKPAMEWLDYDTNECSWFSLAAAQGRSTCQNNTSYGPTLALDEHVDYTSLVLSGNNLWTYNNDLSNPLLTGTLVPELSMLTSLERLDLGVQRLHGSISRDLESMVSSSLKEIVLYDNDLTGTISPAFFSHARQLWLSFNEFTSASTIPPVGPELTSLALTDCNIVGTIPQALFTTSININELYLSSNLLSGSIPSEIGLATSLTTLELHLNSISSSMPTEMGRLEKLQWLSVQGNDLDGTLPRELSAMTSLEYLQLSTSRHRNSALHGTIPQEWTMNPQSWPKLKWFELASTGINGSLPSEFGFLPSLEKLVLDGNRKMSSNVIPSQFGTLQHLSELGLAGMNLESTIPSELGLLSNLKVLRLHDNDLTGSIPMELQSFPPSLEVLTVDGNQGLNGTVPQALCEIDVLQLGCADNGLCGCGCRC